MISLRPVNRTGLIISLTSIALFVWLAAVNPKYIEERIESLTLIYRFQIRNLIAKPHTPDNIVIVMVDEKSLSELGRWPWPRKIQARLISEILDQSPKVLAIDILFPENEDAASDTSLGNSMAPHSAKVVLATGFNVPKTSTDTGGPDAPEYALDATIRKVKDMKLGSPILADRIIPPIQVIGQSAQLGHVYNLKDIDGKTVWEVPFLGYNGDFYPSLALQAARIALDVPMDEMVLYMGRGIGLGSRFIHIAPFGGRMPVNYLGPENSVPNVSASDVLNGTIDHSFFNNKIVFLGTSAIATYDIITTPFSANTPGAEKNATVTENIVNNRFITKTSQGVDMFATLAAGLFLALLLPGMQALQATLYSFLILLGYLTAAQIFFSFYGLWINVVYPVSNILVIFTGTTVTKYFLEEKKAKEIRRIFSSYVSPKIVEEVISHPEKAGLSGQKKTVTILFSDIQGFTSISERNSPEAVVAILNEYFTEMTNIIFKWDGTLDKFVGDEIMAFWGAPVDQFDHAERAIRCALDMSKRLSSLREKWAIEGKEVLNAGLGINTGEVVIGNIGAEGKKMDYTAIGDHVNIAARVEKLTRQYKAKILITEFTQQQISGLISKGRVGHIEIMFTDTVRVKGKDKDLRIYSVRDTLEKEQI
jgi:adenylate cyclase